MVQRKNLGACRKINPSLPAHSLVIILTMLPTWLIRRTTGLIRIQPAFWVSACCDLESKNVHIPFKRRSVTKKHILQLLYVKKNHFQHFVYYSATSETNVWFGSYRPCTLISIVTKSRNCRRNCRHVSFISLICSYFYIHDYNKSNTMRQNCIQEYVHGIVDKND
jgi:hypothetical protein